VWCDDHPEDPVISIFAGCLANHDRAHSLLWVGQLLKVNLDPDTLTDIVSIMVNKLAYKPSVKDIMDKYDEIFRGKNSAN
jgi:hypothetical protein